MPLLTCVVIAAAETVVGVEGSSFLVCARVIGALGLAKKL